MASGYTACPCCGYDTVSDDVNEPELCSDCESAGCARDGSEPKPGCNCLDDEADHEGHPSGPGDCTAWRSER